MATSSFQTSELQEFAAEILCRVGVPRGDAEWVAEALVSADLQGLDSHGISRLGAYVSGIVRGKVNPNPFIEVRSTGPCTAVVDGDNGLGHVVGRRAMETAVDMAKGAGVGVVTVRNGNHAGAMSTYSEVATDAGMIGVALCNAQPAIPPWGGRKAFFGTNPIAVASPCGEHPISIDMATSVVARGKIILSAKKGEPIPEGWALDESGNPTTDASAALRGAVLPMAGAKGYGLALAVEILSGVLSGAKVGSQVGSIYDDEPSSPGTGMFMMALNPDYFVGAAAYTERIQALADAIHAVPPAYGHERVLLPGERRRHLRQVREREGIPLSAATVQELEELAKRYQVRMPAAERV